MSGNTCSTFSLDKDKLYSISQSSLDFHIILRRKGYAYTSFNCPRKTYSAIIFALPAGHPICVDIVAMVLINILDQQFHDNAPPKSDTVVEGNEADWL